MFDDKIVVIQQERLYQWDAFYRLLQAHPPNADRLQWHLQELLFPDRTVDAGLVDALHKLALAQTPSDHQLWLQKTVALVHDTLQQEHEAYYNNGVVPRPQKRARYSVSVSSHRQR